jgi:uncharacterized iron-regulated membrane protein
MVAWVNGYNGEIVHLEYVDQQLLKVVKKLHSELLAGSTGSYVVEFLASWMIVLIVSGIYLYWPSQQGKSVLAKLKNSFFPVFYLYQDGHCGDKSTVV